MKRILVTLAAAGLLAACSDRAEAPAKPVWAQGPVIEAQGRAYVEVPPNRARFSVTFEAKAETSEEASATVVRKARGASSAIRTASNDEVRLTANLSVRPYYDQYERRINEFQTTLTENVHPDHRLGYVASVTVSAEILDPTLTDAARGAALAAGPTSAGSIYFYLEPAAADQRAAHAAAAEDAAARAKIAAAAAGAKLGDLLILQEGSGPCLGSESTAMGRADYDYAKMDGYAAAPAPPPMAPAAAVMRDTAEEDAQAILANVERYKLPADPDPERVEARVCAVYKVR